MYQTAIKHYGHLRTLTKRRKHMPAAGVFTFALCSEMPFMFYRNLIHGLVIFINNEFCSVQCVV